MDETKLLTYLHNYENLFTSLSKHPLKQLGKEKPFVKLYPYEQEEIYEMVKMKFVELFQEFDETRNIPFNDYINTKLRWFSHHLGEKYVQKRMHMKDIQAYELDLIPSDEPELFELVFEEKKESTYIELEQAIETLTDNQKQVIQKLFYENKSVSETAKEMNILPQEVITYKNWACKNLRKKIKKDL